MSSNIALDVTPFVVAFLIVDAISVVLLLVLAVLSVTRLVRRRRAVRPMRRAVARG